MTLERFVRIGDKIVSPDKAFRLLERILDLRARGASQQEVARRFSVDRSFISRVETAGEIRKGRRVAVIGFPVKNKEVLLDICQELGLDFTLILTDRERWDLVGGNNALDFFNRIMAIISRLKEFDTLLLLTSDRWYRLAEALLDLQIIYYSLGKTPVRADCTVDPLRFRNTLTAILLPQPKEEQKDETCGRD